MNFLSYKVVVSKLKFEIVFRQLRQLCENRNIANKSAFHEIYTAFIDRSVAVVFLHGRITDRRDMMTPAYHCKVRSEIPISISDRLADITKGVRRSHDKRVILADTPAFFYVGQSDRLTSICGSGDGRDLHSGTTHIAPGEHEITVRAILDLPSFSSTL